MIPIGAALVGLSIFVPVYAYGIYPLTLRLIAAARTGARAPDEPSEWPRISFSLPAYNEEVQIADTLRSILEADYPADRRQIIVVSDASTDRTDEIVRSFTGRGVELVRLPRRSGKTTAEREAAARIDGDIVVNMDASIRIPPGALKALVRRFQDASVGVASGNDISVSQIESTENAGEAGYVGFEMRIREMETSVSSIVGASGCFYAIRRELHQLPLPASLSRDFAAALHAREHGYRAVTVPDAICFVPRTASLKSEYRRKVRTIDRGMHTLWFKRHLLNPLRHGVFAWMLFSHKVARWLVPWAALLGLVGLALLAPRFGWAAGLLALALVTMSLALVGWLAPATMARVRPVRIMAYLLMSNVAVLHATMQLLLGSRAAIWEPTRRH